MLPFLRLGPFLLQLPGLALLAGLWTVIVLAEKDANRLKLDETALANVVFYGLIGGLVGARLAYAARYLSTYLENPLGLFSLNPQTLAPTEGAVIGLLVAVIYGQHKGLPLRPALDGLARGLAAFLVAVGVAHILSGDAFGTPTDLPWAIYLWDAYRHPTQIYETLLALGVLAAVWRRPLNGDGTAFWWVVLLSAAARVFVEGFRGDSVIWPGGFRAAQVIGLGVILAAGIFLNKWYTPTHSTTEDV